MVHTHPIKDSDTHFKIDAVTRSVKNVSETKTMLVQYDHNSERFTFEVPRFVDEHDLSLCNVVRVHYINIEKSSRTENKGVYEVTDLKVSADDDNIVTCSWLISNNATQLVGSLCFVVQFACVVGGNLLYSWNTAKHTSVSVTDGIYNGDAVVEEYADILAEWVNKIESQITGFTQTQTSNESGGTNIWAVTFADGSTHEMRIKNGEKGEQGIQGIQGEQGIQGIQGEQGEQGKSAYEIALKNGFEGTESEWLESLKGKDGSAVEKGEDGDSAYTVAVNNGFEGTEAEWLASLKGEKGDKGDGDNTYDLVITSDDKFSKCLYALDGGTANAEFKHKTILVKDVTFTTQHGSSDLDLHIFQPSIKYIKFENCRWETEWWVSGKVPTTLAPGGTQYERAQGNLDLIIDGIEVTADNVQSARDAGVYWYIGLRNIKALINSTVRYPDGYDIGTDGWSFKLTCQYFDYASGNHVPALWDGANVSDCYITEKLVRCSGCVNIKATPVLKDGVQNPVAVQTCTNISNFSGEFSYSGCTSVNYDTCEGLEGSSAQGKPYDYIVRNMTELREVLTKSLTGRRILLRDFTINTADTLDFKWAGYVGFSNMLFGADINLANAWELDGAGLDASNNKWSVTVEGAGRSRVCNFGRLPGASTESKYIFKKCRLVTGCIIGEASECSAIHGCYISLNADVVISGCTDICGLTVIPSGRTATTTLSGCKNISHISKKGTGSIIYENCTNVDYFTCDGAEEIPQEDENSSAELVEYVNSTAQRATAIGNPVLVTDAIPLPHKVKVGVKGNRPKNLVPFPYDDMYDANGELIPSEIENGKSVTKVTKNNLTFTVNNDDGSITVSGVASEYTEFLLRRDKTSLEPFKTDTYYTRYKAGSTKCQFDIRYFRGDDTSASYIFIGNTDGTSGKFSSTVGEQYYPKGIDLYLKVVSGTNLTTPETIYPMIVEGNSVEIGEYVPPSAMNPEISTTITTCGKNRIPYPYKQGNSTSGGITWTVNEDGSITANGTATSTAYFSLLNTAGKNTVMSCGGVLSGCPSGGGGSTYRIAITNDQGGYFVEVGSGLQLEKGYGYDEIYIAIAKGYTANNLTFKPQIEYGTTATAYEPYTDKGETITAKDGDTVEVDGILPSTMILADKDAITLTAEYPERIDKTIEKLTQAIIALGGTL